ncbi:MAG: antitoxin VapB family protein [Methanomassiliicoccales archaeon]
MVKTITIREEVYRKLLAMKSDESFSDLIERLVDERGTGILKKIRDRDLISSDAKEEVMAAIYARRSEKREFDDRS